MVVVLVFIGLLLAIIVFYAVVTMHKEWRNPDFCGEFEDLVLFCEEIMYVRVLLNELKLHSHMYVGQLKVCRI
jgi:hypothetical protein